MQAQSTKDVDGDTESAGSESTPLATPAPAYEKIDSTPEGSGEKPADIANIKSIETVKDVKTYKDFARAAAEAMICVLGPESSIFYFPGESGTHWRFLNPGSGKLATIASISALEINWPFEIALAPYGAGYFAYRTSAGATMWSLVPIKEASRPKKWKSRKAFNSAVASFKTLSSWLDQHVVSADDIRTTKVKFGLAGRFMAWKPDGTWVANDLPPQLQAELKSRNYGAETKKMPRHISFGVGNAWAAIWHDGTYTVDLDKNYLALTQCLEDASNQKLLFVSLDLGGKGTEYYARFDPLLERHTMTPGRAKIVSDGFDAVTRKWVIKTGTELQMTSKSNSIIKSRTILTPEDVVAAEATNAARAAKESEVLATEAAKLSIESSKKSISASQVAVVGGVLAIAAGCTVM